MMTRQVTRCCIHPDSWTSTLTQITRHTSHVTHHTSHVTRHTSHITRQTSHITRHTSKQIIKAGVVQSSGIVSLSSVPFGHYHVKLTADMKGQPTTGNFSPQNNQEVPTKTHRAFQFPHCSTLMTRPAVECACPSQTDPYLVSNHCRFAALFINSQAG